MKAAAHGGLEKKKERKVVVVEGAGVSREEAGRGGKTDKERCIKTRVSSHLRKHSHAD